jgi:pimeloyl-ACP methyl ester carboxylesterase
MSSVALSHAAIGIPLIEPDWTTLSNLRTYHFIKAGPKNAPALLFLHGYADSWRSVEPLIPYLSKNFRIYALDQRGHGQTDDDFDRFTIDDFAADAADFIRWVIERPVILVGHSFGSLVAQRVAVEHKDLVSRLVLISAADHAAGNSVLTEMRDALGGLGEKIPRSFVQDFQAGMISTPLFLGQLDIFVNESMRVSPMVWRKTAESLAGDGKVVAGQIAAPTLVLWGANDPVFSVETQQRLMTLLKDGRLQVYPEVGHAPNWEEPETVARDIAAFAL